MISVIVYGRNDQHGYNFHKRIAIGINCIAEVLTDPSDEILFVDDNTPNDLPTILEAIEDTLTPKAKELLKIFRVRPSLHRKIAKNASAHILESVSRNIAIRRSNPENRWVLSTNIDMIFVPKDKTKSLSDLVAKLPDGFYMLPRFELPEGFWEVCLNRSQPKENISFLRDNNMSLKLNSTVRIEGYLKFDNPGDFQLILRDDLFKIGGFDERMSIGFHIDSNICKRMALLGKEGISLENEIYGYHCNHNIKEPLKQSSPAVENDWNYFVRELTSPLLANDDWGAPNEDIEEVHLEKKAHYNSILSALSRESLDQREFCPHRDKGEIITYSSKGIFSHLVDHIFTLPRNSNLAYIGYNAQTLELLQKYLRGTGFKGQIFVLKGFVDAEESDFITLKDLNEITRGALLYIFDFGFDLDSKIGREIKQSEDVRFEARKKLQKVIDAFLSVMRSKKRVMGDAKFVGINALHTDIYTVFQKHLSTRRGSFASGVSFGHFFPKMKRVKIFSLFKVRKRAVIFNLQYLVIRHLFSVADRIRDRISKTRMAKRT